MRPVPDDRPPRRTERPFPAYRFIPGENPHPTEDPAGHSYGCHPSAVAALTEKGWSWNPAYLFGVDLYNHLYWWEAHEAWEGLWRLSGRDDRTGRFLQGLIKISAAFLKRRLRQERGVRLSFGGGVDLLSGVASECPVYMGLDIRRYLAKLETGFRPVLAGPPSSWPDPAQDYPYLVLEDV